MDVMSTSLAISASALRAERLRLDVIASNLANASTYLWVAYLVGFMVLVAEQALV